MLCVIVVIVDVVCLSPPGVPRVELRTQLMTFTSALMTGKATSTSALADGVTLG